MVCTEGANKVFSCISTVESIWYKIHDKEVGKEIGDCIQYFGKNYVDITYSVSMVISE